MGPASLQWQVRVITLNDAGLAGYAKPIVNELRATMVRVATDFGSDPIRAKIANAEQVKSIPCWWSPVAIPICGAGNVSVRLHGKGNIGAKPKGKAVKDILAAIEKRWS